MASVTDCHDCGAPDAVLIAEDVDEETGAWSGLYLCRGCAAKREGLEDSFSLQGSTDMGMQQRSSPVAAWQPIETAPTNQSILIFVPTWEHYGPGIYRAILVDMGTGRHWLTTAWAIGRDLQDGYDPTHWMPLPEPPVDGVQAATRVNSEQGERAT
jgi:hypothetical protein